MSANVFIRVVLATELRPLVWDLSAIDAAFRVGRRSGDGCRRGTITCGTGPALGPALGPVLGPVLGPATGASHRTCFGIMLGSSLGAACGPAGRDAAGGAAAIAATARSAISRPPPPMKTSVSEERSQAKGQKSAVAHQKSSNH